MLVPKERDAVPLHSVGQSKLLLCEGATPWHFFEAMARHIGVDNQVEIHDYGGIKEFRSFLLTIAASSAFRDKVQSLGIVRDAEENAKAALDSVADAVAAAKLPPKVKVSYFILPDNIGPGMIETLFTKVIQTMPVYECIQKFIECARAKGYEFPAGNVLAKYQTQIYLSTLKKPLMMPGTASYSHYGAWSLDHEVFKHIKAFLQDL